MPGRITRTGYRQGAVKGVRGPRSAHTTRNVYSQLSGLADVVFNDFIKDDFISEGDGQAASGSVSLRDLVVLETDSGKLEREQNERDVLEALGEYNGMSVENVPAVVHIKTLKVRFIARKFSTGLAVGVVKSVEKKSVQHELILLLPPYLVLGRG